MQSRGGDYREGGRAASLIISGASKGFGYLLKKPVVQDHREGMGGGKEGSPKDRGPERAAMKQKKGTISSRGEGGRKEGLEGC